jgi:hypothetical protein
MFSRTDLVMRLNATALLNAPALGRFEWSPGEFPIPAVGCIRALREMKCATQDEPNETARDLLGGLKAAAGK